MGPELIAAAATVQGLISLALLRLLAPAAVLGERKGLTVSLIIPARNEAHNLPRLLRSLPENGLLEVLVVDDDSSDGTAAVAVAHRAQVIASGGLPPGWIGKTWACWQGAQAAKGELLLFVDADCWFQPGGYEGILARYAGGALAVLPYHEVKRPHEQLSAFFNLIMAASNLRRELFGQCLLVERSGYLAAGGHGAVKDRILENVALGEVLRAEEMAVTSIPGHGLVSMRMYPEGLGTLIQGWSKGFAAGAASVSRPRLLLISCFLGGLFVACGLPLVQPWFAALYLAYAILLAALLRRVGSFPFRVALLYPLPLVFYHVVFLRALAGGGKNATWKGRSLDAA